MKKILLFLTLLCPVLSAHAQTYYEADSVLIYERTSKVQQGHFDIAFHADEDGEYFVLFKNAEAIMYGYSSVLSKDTVSGGVMYFCRSSVTQEPIVVLVRKESITYMYGSSPVHGDSLSFEHQAIFNLIKNE